MPPVPIRTKEVVPEGREGELTEAQRLAEETKRLEAERQERLGAKLGQAGRPFFGAQQGPPPKKSTQAPIAQTQVPPNALSQMFAQMTSIGYKPSDAALRDSGNQSTSGSIALSRTWLATLFLRLLKRKNFVD